MTYWESIIFSSRHFPSLLEAKDIVDGTGCHFVLTRKSRQKIRQSKKSQQLSLRLISADDYLTEYSADLN